MYHNMAGLYAIQMNNNSIREILPYTFDGLESLRAILLSNNFIAGLSPLSFQRGLTNLEAINLEFNMIASIPPQSFAHLLSLTNLFLNYNRITVIGNMAFPGNLHFLFMRSNNIIDGSMGNISIANLATLDVGMNNLTTLSPSTLPFMPKLTVLNVDSNHIEHLEEGMCQMMPMVTHVNAENNQLNESNVFEKDVYAGCTALRHLYFKRNSISSLKHFFYFPSISAFVLELDLSENPIRSLHMPQYNNIEDRAPYFSMATRLLCDSCLIESVEPRDLLYFRRLRELSLRNNKLRVFPEFLDGLHETSSFELSGNPIDCSCNMTWLRVSESKQRLYVLGGCKHMMTREWIKFNEVPVSEFLCPVKYFCDNLNCECFTNSSSTGSEPSVVNCARRALHQVPNPLAPSATDIHLEFNTLEFLHFDMPWIMHTEKLSLHYSGIRHIDFDAFQRFPKLIHLLLHENLLTEFSWQVVGNLAFLKELTLHGNLLMQIHPSGLEGSTPQMASLTLYNNHLATLDLTFMRMLASLPHLYNLILGRNPWNCSGCHGPSMRDWLVENSKKIIDLATITCDDKDRFNNSSIFYLDPELFGTYVLCKNGTLPVDHVTRIAPIIGASFAVLIVCIAISTLLYHFRLHIVIVALNMWPMLKHLRPELDVPNDIYVVHNEFSGEVRQWVMMELYPRIIKMGGNYRVALPDSFLGGFPRAEATRRVVELSKRTLIVLSADFMDDEWALYAFQSAHQRSLEDPRHRLIIVQYTDDIPMEALDRTLRAYVKAKQYLSRNKARFWPDLIHRLPPETGRQEVATDPLNSLWPRGLVKMDHF